MVETVSIPKPLKYLFFTSFKKRKEYKQLQNEIGEIKDVTIVIAKGKGTLRASSGTQKSEVPFTDEEMKSFLKNLNIKEDSISDCKSIFVLLDMIKHNVHIQKNKIDGTKQEFVI